MTSQQQGGGWVIQYREREREGGEGGARERGKREGMGRRTGRTGLQSKNKLTKRGQWRMTSVITELWGAKSQHSQAYLGLLSNAFQTLCCEMLKKLNVCLLGRTCLRGSVMLLLLLYTA